MRSPFVLALILASFGILPRSARAEEPPSAPADPPLVSAPTPAPLAPPLEGEEPAPTMSEGRTLVSLYNSGFQWGLSPGVVFRDGKAGFFLGVQAGYGFDLGAVIVVPGARVAGYFLDPNVYVGLPTVKLVVPIDRVAPFVVGGVGYGRVAADGTTGAAAGGGAAVVAGGGLMIHFPRVAFGAEAEWQKITGTDFQGVSVGPILAIGF